MRLILQVLGNRKLRGELRVYDAHGLLTRILAVKDLGRCAYYACRVAQHVTELDLKVEPEILGTIQRMAKAMMSTQDDAFEKKDLGKASSVIDRMDLVRENYEALFKNAPSDLIASLPFSLMVRDIRGVAGYAVALADDAVLAAFG